DRAAQFLRLRIAAAHHALAVARRDVLYRQRVGASRQYLAALSACDARREGHGDRPRRPLRRTARPRRPPSGAARAGTARARRAPAAADDIERGERMEPWIETYRGAV